MLKDKQWLEGIAKKKKEAKEIEEKVISAQGDIRDKFLVKGPFLAPKDFKPLQIH